PRGAPGRVHMAGARSPDPPDLRPPRGGAPGWDRAVDDPVDPPRAAAVAVAPRAPHRRAGLPHLLSPAGDAAPRADRSLGPRRRVARSPELPRRAPGIPPRPLQRAPRRRGAAVQRAPRGRSPRAEARPAHGA